MEPAAQPQEKSFDIISIGDSTIDVFLEIHDANAVCSIDSEKCWFCVNYADKIAVDKLTRVPAVGNSASNSIGSVRLGLKAAIYTHLGDDKDGEESRQIFEKEDVATDFIRTDKGKRTNFSSVINFQGERVIFVYHVEREYRLPDLPSTSWVYYSSVGKGHEVLNGQLIDYIKRTEARLGYNPGTYQLKTGIDEIKKVLEVCETLILNREEAHQLVGGEVQDTKNLLKSLRDHGAKTVVITDARNGSYLSDGEKYLHCGIPEESPVVERTGVGDAYSTGFIAALIKGSSVDEAMIQATLNSTSVIQYIGAREGLLTLEGVEKVREKWGNSFRVTELTK